MRAGTFIAGLVLVMIIMLGANACRGAEIDRCRESGGQPVTSAWWTEDYFNVRCVEGRP